MKKQDLCEELSEILSIPKEEIDETLNNITERLNMFFGSEFSREEVEWQISLLIHGIRSPESVSSEDEEEFLENLEAARQTGFINDDIYTDVKEYFRTKRN